MVGPIALAGAIVQPGEHRLHPGHAHAGPDAVGVADGLLGVADGGVVLVLPVVFVFAVRMLPAGSDGRDEQGRSAILRVGIPALAGLSVLPMAAPVGGMLLIAGWALVGASALWPRRT